MGTAVHVSRANKKGLTQKNHDSNVVSLWRWSGKKLKRRKEAIDD